tara:strand:- start:127 stop:1716 length:1590 start_codon:yes stop_codon:yes gene_type:complete
MTKIFSNYAFNQKLLDLNLLFSNFDSSKLENNINEKFNGFNYTDLYVVDWSLDGNEYGTAFGGPKINFNSSQNTVSGTVTGYFEFIEGGGDDDDYLPVWGMQDFRVDAADLYSAAKTSSTKDDYKFINAELSGSDTFNLSDYNDYAIGYDGNDKLYGNDGNDTLYGKDDNDTLYGGSGNDKLYGGKHDDRIQGDAGNDTLSGSSGKDRLYGKDDDDKLYGGTGSDKLYGGSGNDRLRGDTGNDILNGGSGTDTIVFSGKKAVTVNLASTKAQDTGHGKDTISEVENVTSDKGADKLLGNSAVNILTGNDGNDKLYGKGGNDKLYGKDDDDKLYGGTGDDKLYGGKNNDRIQGDTGNDTLSGSSGSDRLYGKDDNDKLYGGTGKDELYGGSGDDKLDGGSSGDLLQGGAGADTMTGGTGADEFVFKKASESNEGAADADIITDFKQGIDIINLKAIDASTELSGNNKFTFDGATAIEDSVRGDITYKKTDVDGTENDYTMIYIDTDDDRDAEMSIRLTGLYDLSADDFIL